MGSLPFESGKENGLPDWRGAAPVLTLLDGGGMLPVPAGGGATVDGAGTPLLGFHPPHGASIGTAHAKPSRAAPMVNRIAGIMVGRSISMLIVVFDAFGFGLVCQILLVVNYYMLLSFGTTRLLC